jgi:cyanophycinase
VAALIMGIIALAGGNEFRDNCVSMDRRLLSLIPKPAPRVAILPTAAVRGSPRAAADNGVRHFNALGVSAFPVMIITRDEANDPAKVKPLIDADLIYIAGGDPGYLLDVLRDSALLAAIQDVYKSGGIIAGSSAGAMVLSAQMRKWNEGEWVSGLGFVPDVAVLVHHNGTDSATQQATLQSQQTNSDPAIIVGIAESTACFSADNHNWEVAGNGSVTVYRDGNAVSYTHGQQFTL